MNINNYIDLIKKHTGLEMYPEQIKAAKELAKGNICDMKTGEGKTLTIILATLLAVEKHKVFVNTSNDYLSKRDYEYALPIYNELGLKAIFLRSSVGGSAEMYKDANIIYSTAETLIFDYLRGVEFDKDFAIVDEIDYVLVECANHDFSVSDNNSEVKMPEGIFYFTHSLAKTLKPFFADNSVPKEDILFDAQHESDVIVYKVTHSVDITKRGWEKIEKIVPGFSKDMLSVEILHATLLAKYFYIRNVSYIVENDKLTIITESNGRISIGGSNDIFIQTAMEVNENLPITNKALLVNTCSFPVFYSCFKTLTGISGTTSFVPYDFNIIYSKDVIKIPEHQKNQRKEIYKYFDSTQERDNEFLLPLINENDGPFLVVTDSDKESQRIHEFLKQSNKEIFLLDNLHLSEEENLLEKATNKKVVLVSNKIVGRGTDITAKVEEGLTVVIYRRFPSLRAERQVVGRTGRNGRKGTAYILSSLDDDIYGLGFKKEMSIKNREKLVKIFQDRYESNAFETRKHIYINSKLYFDEDEAIKKEIEGYKFYNDIYNYLDKKNKKYVDKIGRDKQLPYAVTILMKKAYANIRPFYQQQFKRYLECMSSSLMNDTGFCYVGKELVKMGREVLSDVINDTINAVRNS